MPAPIDLDLATLRRYAIARSLGAPASLARAIERSGFVQADPIRAPAHAQDLTLRHRDRGEAHPREVDRRFAHGSVTNYWGGSSRATTHLLELLHYRGDLRPPPR